jgi:hypothetical protein
MSYQSTVLANGPLRYYRLGESSGVTVQDIGAERQNGTISGGVTLAQPGLLARDLNTSMLFDGASGQISLPTTLLPAGASAVSLEAWVYYATLPTPGSGYSAIVYLGSNVNFETFGLYFHTGGFIRLTWATSSLNSANGSIVAGQIYHIVATYDGTNVNLYINGSLVAGPAVVAQNLIYGVAAIGNDATNDFGSGVIDEVAIYAYALSPTQVAADYLAGTVTTTQEAVGELSKAIYAKLTGDATLIALLAAPLLGTYSVFDFGAVPENQPFPYLTLGDADQKPDNAFGTRGYITRYRIGIWDSQFGGFQKSQQILARLNFLLDQKKQSDMPLATQKLIYFLFQDAIFMNDPGDYKILHTTVEYEAFTQE